MWSLLNRSLGNLILPQDHLQINSVIRITRFNGSQTKEISHDHIKRTLLINEFNSGSFFLPFSINMAPEGPL